jgi:hypothetical protein
MTPAKLQALLAKTNTAIVGVNRATGGPQLTEDGPESPLA